MSDRRRSSSGDVDVEIARLWWRAFHICTANATSNLTFCLELEKSCGERWRHGGDDGDGNAGYGDEKKIFSRNARHANGG
eukprot:scaffold15373_cov115-Isochrysis_galbana.AAC.5